jgi:predicted HAD superfamily Cof-like phosphohydrolase
MTRYQCDAIDCGCDPEPSAAWAPPSSLEAVREFHDACAVPTPTEPAIPTDRHTRDELQFAAHNLRVALRAMRGAVPTMPLRRACLMVEELGELLEAMADGDVVDALDALCDLRYVTDGTVLELGFAPTFDLAFAEVHRSNMSKVVDGKVQRDPMGKVLKPEGYTPPDLAGLLGRPRSGK